MRRISRLSRQHFVRLLDVTTPGRPGSRPAETESGRRSGRLGTAMLRYLLSNKKRHTPQGCRRRACSECARSAFPNFPDRSSRKFGAEQHVSHYRGHPQASDRHRIDRSPNRPPDRAHQRSGWALPHQRPRPLGPPRPPEDGRAEAPSPALSASRRCQELPGVGRQARASQVTAAPLTEGRSFC